MVISCRYEIYWVRKRHSGGDFFRPFPPEGSFIVTTKSVDSTLSRDNYCVKSSTGNFQDFLPEEGIGYDGECLGRVCVLFSHVEVLNVGKADGSLGLAVTSGMIVLVGLTRSVDVEFQFFGG